MPTPKANSSAARSSTKSQSPTSASASGEESLLQQFGAPSETTEFYSPIPEGYEKGRHKYVAVFGTVMSGLGKGIFSSSLAKLLKNKGFSVAPVKLEGYLNVDAGTLNPYRHGEVFVLDDGTECDMDLGTYERMLNQNLSKRNFTTAGQVFTTVLERERRGEYLGRDVQMIPHVTGEVKRKLRELAMKGNDGEPTDVVFVEVGGTAGDYENGFYIEALRELAFEEGVGNFCFVALTYVIEPEILGEQKSKAAQLGIKRLMEAGIQPHIVACRAKNPVQDSARQKIAMFSNVPLNRTFSMHDRKSIYVIPNALRAQGLDNQVLGMLNLHDRVNTTHDDEARTGWSHFANALTGKKKHKIKLGITGKYIALRDAYASIDKAIEHCSAELSVEIDAQWIDTTEIDEQGAAKALANVDGIIVPGGFGSRGVEGKMHCVKYCRENMIPYMGICLGFQVAVIEYARNVLGWTDANSTEFTPEGAHSVIGELPEQKEIEGLGGTMRLGGQEVEIEPNTLAEFLYQGTAARERFRHRWEVEPKLIDDLQQAGLIYSGKHPDQPIMQILELPQSVHPYFIAGQFHPELTSRCQEPNPLFAGLIAAAIHHAHPELKRSEISDRWLRPFDAKEDGNHQACGDACVSIAGG